MSYQRVLMFDLDDTLVDHSTALRLGAHALAAAAQVEGDRDVFAARWQEIHLEKYPRYLRGELRYEDMCRQRIWESINAGLSPEDADDLFTTYKHAYHSAWRLFDDVLPCLRALASFRLGIVSNGRSAEQRAKLQVLRLDTFFEQISLSEETGISKPDRGMYLVSCAAMQVSPESVVYVGDNYEVDYLGARAAGLSAIWLDRTARGRADEMDAAMRITSLDQLQPALERRSSEFNAS